MTKDNWIKALHKIATDYVLSKSQSGPYDLVFSCDEEVKDLENLLSQVEKDAEKRGYLQASKDLEEARKEFDKTEKEIVEKTNKRWRERIKSKIIKNKSRYIQIFSMSSSDTYNQALSDLLEDKESV